MTCRLMLAGPVPMVRISQLTRGSFREVIACIARIAVTPIAG